MTSDIFFDNFIISGDRRVVDDWASDGWGLKKAADGAAEVCACSFPVHSYLLL
jgi:calnexin